MDDWFPGSDDKFGFEEVEVPESELEYKVRPLVLMLILNLLLVPMLLHEIEGDGDEDDDEYNGGISDGVRCVHDYISNDYHKQQSCLYILLV